MSFRQSAVSQTDVWRYFLITICLMIPFFVRYHLLAIPTIFNVDEAQWTATARRILDDPIVWRSADMETSGPLNGLVISWPVLFGMVPSLFTSRLTGLLLQSGAIAGVAALWRPRHGLGLGAAAALTASIYLGLLSYLDFVSYTSEDLSLLLIVLFCASYMGVADGRWGAFGWAACGLIATALPLAKLQSAPFCLLFHGLCAGRLLLDLAGRRLRWSHAAAYIAGSILPLLLLVAPLFAVGEQNAFLVGYIGRGSNYGGVKNFYPFRRVTAVGALMLIYMGFLASRFAGRLGELRHARWDLLLLSLGLWPAVLLAIWLPGRPFVHYGLFMLVGTPLSVAVMERALPLRGPIPRPVVRAIQAVSAGAVALMLVIMVPWLTIVMARASTESAFASPATPSESRPLFAWTGVGSRDAMFVWGWTPELIDYANLKSADRSAIAEYLIRPNSGRDYYRQRLLQEFNQKLPALVVDSIRSGYFFANYLQFQPATSNLQSFPPLYNIVRANYEQIGKRPECPGIYLRHDLVKPWQEAEIPLQSAAPELVDNSMTENCADWWAPADPSHATVELTPAHPEQVREVWILASRGGFERDRGTSAVAVTFVHADGTTREEVVKLFDYPLWTVVARNDERPVARIAIHSVGYVGAGPALSEVKAFRKEIGRN